MNINKIVKTMILWCIAMIPIFIINLLNSFEIVPIIIHIIGSASAFILGFIFAKLIDKWFMERK